MANLRSFENNGIQVLAFRQPDSTVVGILPFVLRHGRRYIRSRNWLELAGMPHADYGACLVLQGFEPGVAALFLEYLLSTSISWEGVYLEKLKEEDPFANSLLSLAHSRKIPVHCRDSYQIRRLTREGYSGASSLKTSKSLARAKKRLSEFGEIQFEVSTTDQEIQDRLEQYFRMHIARFSSKGMQSPFVQEQHQRFFRSIVHECAPEGYVWLSSLCVDGSPIATKLTLLYGQTLHLYSTCFAQEFSRYSPSMLQLDMLLEYAFANEIEVVDFGVGESPQKEQAGASVAQTLVRIELYRNWAAHTESTLFQAVEQAQGKSELLRRTGKALRGLLPYRM
jgi:CelD/BcsL family acetyltransferase involved in cellulose biosynthesis